MLRKWVALFALLGAGLLHGQTGWIRMQSENFQIYSGAGERETRDALQYFERVRAFFLKMTGRTPENPVPVYIVLFRNEKEYLPYRFNEFAEAYFFGGAERDYIVLGKPGEQTAHAATHEYVHLVMRHAQLQYPPWLSEGLAELYSTLKTIGDNIEFGNVIPGRLQAAARERWVPLATILEADHDSAYYNESDKAGSLYSQGWALVHMLATTDEFRPRFGDVLLAILRGTPSVQALEQTYGRPLARIERDLQAYIRGNSFKRLVVREGLDLQKLRLRPEPADMFDVNLALADLLTRPEQAAERRQRLRELARQNPLRPEPEASLAYIAWRERDMEQAVNHFAQAYQLGARSPKLLWDYARLAERDRPEDSIRALKDLLALQPGHVEARIELAAVNYYQRRWGDVVGALAGPMSITPEQAPRVFQMAATAQLQLGGREEARASANKLLEFARTDAEREEAQRILAYLDQLERRTAPAAAAEQPRAAAVEFLEQETAPAPALVRRDEAAAPPDEAQVGRAILHDAEGVFVELICAGDVAGMVLETAEGRQTFMITEPNRMIVTGREPGMVELQCGPQPKREKLRIQYTEAPAGDRGAGIVRAVHFGP